MRIDIDTYHELLQTLSRNKTRTFLTGFGVFWGVFMLLGLIGGGAGLEQMLSSNFEGFATNSAWVFEQQTTKPYKGHRKGRWWSLCLSDVERLRQQVAGIDVVTPVLSQWGVHAVVGDKVFSAVVKGIYPDYARVETPKLLYGRYLSDADMVGHRKVCVIGRRVYESLFPYGGDPCGSKLRLDSTYYTVIGVNVASGGININGSANESVYVPIPLMRATFNRGEQVDLLALTVRKGVTVTDITPAVKHTIQRAHEIAPTDDDAVMVFNTEVMFGLMESLFSGVNLLILLVGIGTLLAGAIGVSNIMMVTVRERTTEIGIRRAIGATPRMVLAQILSESLLLTIVAGCSGIVFAVIVLQMLQMGVDASGGATGHFQVSFGAAIGAAVLLSVLGVVAGLAPAMRAMTIKPVDAMRED